MAAAVLALCAGVYPGLSAGQQAPAGQNQSQPGKSGEKSKSAKSETRITPEEAKKLFAMVDQLLAATRRASKS